MKCPYCGEIDNKVIDSRLSKDAISIRRRRECIACSRRFTTYEHIEEIPIMIIKKDGRREIFNRDKVRVGIHKACEKRGISAVRKAIMSPGLLATCISCGGASTLRYASWLIAMIPGSILMIAAMFVSSESMEWSLNIIGVILMIVIPLLYAPLHREHQ